MNVVKPINILSLGAGVQSSTLLLMSIRGVLPKLDHAIFSDTQWEPQEVYDWLEILEVMSEDAGIPVTRVTAGNLREHTMKGFIRGPLNDGERYASLPLVVKNLITDPVTGRQTEKIGRIRRQCTREYKIEPIEKFVRRELLGVKKHCMAPRNAVLQWFGISSDEHRRARMSPDRWKTNVYPLLGLPEVMLPHPYSRDDCRSWLAKHYPDFWIPRSSCLGCPFHTTAEWRAVRKRSAEWADVVEVDKTIRHADGMHGLVYLHHDAVPLDEVDFRQDTDMGQNLLFGGMEEECLGYCGT